MVLQLLCSFSCIAGSQSSSQVIMCSYFPVNFLKDFPFNFVPKLLIHICGLYNTPGLLRICGGYEKSWRYMDCPCQVRCSGLWISPPVDVWSWWVRCITAIETYCYDSWICLVNFYPQPLVISAACQSVHPSIFIHHSAWSHCHIDALNLQYLVYFIHILFSDWIYY